MPLGRKRRDYSRFDEHPLIAPARRPKAASDATSLLPHIMTPSELADKAVRLFAPNLSPVKRRDRTPANPTYALRGSLLPPPAAEVDERPRERTRRFKLFTERTPGLRICVLDPRQREHLQRWRSFAVPSHESVPVPTRGDARRLSPRGPHIPREPFGVLPAPVQESAVDATTTATPEGQITPATPPSPLPTGQTPKARPAQLKRNRAQRRDWRHRLQEHLWVLDMEYERRFRAAMNRQMDAMVDWQDANLRPRDEWETLGPWRDGVDVAEIQHWVNLFRTIRDDPQLYDILDFTPVPGHVEAIQGLEEENQQRLVRKEKRKNNREKKEKGKTDLEDHAEKAGQREQTTSEPVDRLLEKEDCIASTALVNPDTPQQLQTDPESPTDKPPPAKCAAVVAESASDAAPASPPPASVPQSKRDVLREILDPAKTRVGRGVIGPTGHHVVPEGPEDTDALIESILEVPFPQVINSIGKHGLLGDLLDQLHRLEAQARALERLECEVIGGRVSLIAEAPAAGPSRPPVKNESNPRETRGASDSSPKQREADQEHKKGRRERKPLDKAAETAAGETSDSKASNDDGPIDPSPATAPSATNAISKKETSDFDPDDFKLVFPDLMAKLRVLDITVHDAEPALPRPVPSSTAFGTATLGAIVEEGEDDNTEDSEVDDSTAQRSASRHLSTDSSLTSAGSMDPYTHQHAASRASWAWRGDLYRDEDTVLPSGTKSPP